MPAVGTSRAAVSASGFSTKRATACTPGRARQLRAGLDIAIAGFRRRSAACRRSRSCLPAPPPPPRRSAASKASVSAIEASAAIIHSTASGLSSATSTAAAAMAGALLRPTGSSMIRASGRRLHELFGDQEPVLFVADHDRRGEAGPAATQHGFLDQGAVRQQRPELLREALPRDRP